MSRAMPIRHPVPDADLPCRYAVLATGGLPVAKVLIDRGADLRFLCEAPGHMTPGRVHRGPPLGYALLSPVRMTTRQSRVVSAESQW